jgi:hypothetical protein
MTKSHEANNDRELNIAGYSLKMRHALGVVAAGLTVGVAWGIAVESQTNQIARGKIITAEYCQNVDLKSADTINQGFLKCVEDGVPGGNKIGHNKFHAGDPVGFVDSYIAAQKAEAASIEPGRIVAWSAAPFGVAAICGWWGFID